MIQLYSGTLLLVMKKQYYSAWSNVETCATELRFQHSFVQFILSLRQVGGLA